MTIAPYTVRIEQRKDYVARLIVALADIGATARYNDDIELQGGVRIRVDLSERADQAIGPVTIYSGHGYGRHAGRSIFKTTDLKHIVKNARRITAKRLKVQQEVAEYHLQQEAEEARLKQAGAVVTAAVEAINNLTPANSPGSAWKAVSSYDVGTSKDGVVFEFALRNLTEAQALAILAIVKGDR